MTGPEIAETLEMATSTVSAVLKRIGLGKLGPEGQKYADQIKKVQDDIASGKISNIPDTVK